MEYAIVNNQKTSPQPSLRGSCQGCGKIALAKCGPQIQWHWAHYGKKHCDQWWENETQWHRMWKSFFPESCREVIHHDSFSGEKHIADIKTSDNVVIELQHSAMPLEELRSREEFYKRIIWVVDAQPFEKNFCINDLPLPHPTSPICQDVRFFGLGKTAGGMFKRPSDEKNLRTSGAIYPRRLIEDEIKANYKGHHFFEWKRPRSIWLQAEAPVFFDFGGDFIFWLQTYDDTGQRCVQRISKQKFIEKYGGTYTAPKLS